MPLRVPTFELPGHQLGVKAGLPGRPDARFAVDTGVGITAFSTALLAETGGSPSGTTFTGRRMSGQALTVPLAEVPWVEVGGRRFERVPVGLIDLAPFVVHLGPLAGILSLPFFRGAPITLDAAAQTLTVEDEVSLAERERQGWSASVEVERDGPSEVLFLRLQLPHVGPVRVEVDTGSYSLILDRRFMSPLGIAEDDPALRTRQGTDETGHLYTRYSTRLSGAIHPDGLPEVRQVDPEVTFQEIIYDGLVGREFLDRQPVTYDPARSRVLFGPRSPPSAADLPCREG
jgi:hypothetical protein